MAKARKAKAEHRPKPSYKALGAAIKQLREEQDLLQADVAEKTGLNPSYVSDIERGKRNPTWKVLSQFAKAFGVKLSELVQRAEQQR